MADPSVAELPQSDLCINDFSAEMDSLPIPSMDDLFFPDKNDPMHSQAFPSVPEFGLGFGENGDFDITFDDLDNLCIPSATEDFVLPDGYNPDNGSIMQPGLGPGAIKYQNVANLESLQCGTSPLSGNRSSEVDGCLNLQPSDSASCKREHSPVVSMDNSGDQNYLQSNDVKVSSSESRKRKKEQTEGNPEVRTTKDRRSMLPMEDSAQQSPLDDEDEKRKARLMRNRSAQLSRQRKKHYVEELEEKVRSMHSTITELSSSISFVMAENATLRQQLSGGGISPPPPPGMYPHPPMGPMPYTWMPCAPYVVKPRGSQVPLVPIPRLKSQQPVSAPKTEKSKTRKSERKTKKVASISFLGLFFFIFLFLWSGYSGEC